MNFNKTNYLKRIKIEDNLPPTLDTLKLLQKAHLINIPFENLDIHYNLPIELDINKIFNKIIHQNRGGFCYELNGLFNELLTALGFKTKRISARVFDKEKGYGKEFDHMAIVVTIGQKEYLSDVGFGEFAFTPLELKIGEIHKDLRGDFTIDHHIEEYIRISKIINGQAIPEYIFKNTARELSEFSEMCLYHQTNPNSHFTKKRIISRPTENGRISLTDNLIKRTANNISKEQPLKNEIEFDLALWKHFRIRID